MIVVVVFAAVVVVAVVIAVAVLAAVVVVAAALHASTALAAPPNAVVAVVRAAVAAVVRGAAAAGPQLCGAAAAGAQLCGGSGWWAAPRPRPPSAAVAGWPPSDAADCSPTARRRRRCGFRCRRRRQPLLDAEEGLAQNTKHKHFAWDATHRSSRTNQLRMRRHNRIARQHIRIERQHLVYSQLQMKLGAWRPLLRRRRRRTRRLWRRRAVLHPELEQLVRVPGQAISPHVERSGEQQQKRKHKSSQTARRSITSHKQDG